MSLSPDLEPTQAADGSVGPQGRLKIYLGYAPHTGKTWRLLEEARRRRSRGEDVVIGWLRRKDQPAVSGMLEGLEHIPPREANGVLALDLDAILARGPEVCFVDELAAANPPGFRNRHRWQDVRELLDAGISVVTAVNIQYVEALRAKILKHLGRAPEETVPDEFLREAEEILLVDASLESVKERGGDMSERDLLALREMALLYSADAVEENVMEYRQEHRIERVWETQERIMVCLTAYSRGPLLIERAHHVAERFKGELWAVYVTPDEKWSNVSAADAERVRGFLGIARSKGAQVEVLLDTDPAHGIMEFARRRGITQIFLGHAAAYPFRGALSRTVAGRILHEATGMDVNVVADDVKFSPDVTAPSPPQPQLPFLARLLSGAPRPESRGHLRIYLGYAPGVGKTYQMLLDGQYLRDQGQDVVVGYVETGGREDLTELLGTLEVAARLEGGAIDMEALKRRRPQICLVDDLATFGDDSKRRWEKVEELRDAGIHVFTTLDVSEVESLKDTVECIAALKVRETVPDWIVEEADEVIFVDVPIRALLNRVKRGVVFIGDNVVPEDLHTYFTEGCLSALRELAMRLTADRVQDDLEELDETRAKADASDSVLVCVHARPSGGAAVRRARRAADRLGAPCYAVFVAPDEDWTGISPEDKAIVEEHLELARTLHIETHVLYGSNIARTLVDFSIRHNVTRIFLGRSHKTGWREFFQRSVIEQVIRLSPKTDIHVVADR